LRLILASPTVLEFSDLDETFKLHTNASNISAGSVIVHKINGTVARTDGRGGSTERK